MSAFLISSSSINQTEEQVSKIVKNKTYESFDSNDLDLNNLIEELSYTSLFSEERIILIKNADFFSSTKSSFDLTLLENFITKLDDSITIIFTTNQKPDERKKITKLIKEKNNLFILPPLTIKEIAQKLEAFFKNNGYKISQESLYYIVNSSLNNYDLSLKECEKVLLYYANPCEISLSDLKHIISSPLESNNFKLVENVVNHNVEEAFKIYQDLKIQKVEPIVILNLLAREYRLMYLVSLMLKSHLSPFEIAKKLSLQTWQVDKSVNNSFNYNLNELENNLKELAKIDLQIKQGKLNKHLALEMFILKNS